MSRRIEIRESARQYRTPTLLRVVKVVQKWKQRRQQRRLARENSSEAARAPQRVVNARGRRRGSGRGTARARPKWWQRSRFWRHLQSQVNPASYQQSKRLRRNDGSTTRAQDSTTDTPSPFSSDRGQDRRPRSTSTERLRGKSDSRRSSEVSTALVQQQEQEDGDEDEDDLGPPRIADMAAERLDRHLRSDGGGKTTGSPLPS